MKLLLVDDEEPLRRLLAKHLTGFGYEVVTAENGLEAVALSKSESPDAILMDLEMPKMDGVKAVESIRSHPETAPLPVVILTGAATGENVRKAKRAGADWVLVKSDVKLGEFPGKLRTLVEGKKGGGGRSAPVRKEAAPGSSPVPRGTPPSVEGGPRHRTRSKDAASASSPAGSGAPVSPSSIERPSESNEQKGKPRSQWPLVSREKASAVLHKSVELKALPFVATEIIRVSNSSQSTAKELAGVLQQDQALTAQVLKLANSALYGDGGRVRNLTHAVMKIGFKSIRDLALAVALMDEYREVSLGRGIPLLEFWKHSLASGCLARGLAAAARFDVEKADGAFLGGLLHDLGELILSDQFRDEYAQVVEHSLRGEGRIFDLEREAFGLDHCEVAEGLLRKWKFSESLIKPIMLHHRPWIKASASGGPEDLRLTAVVRLSSALAQASGIGSDGDMMLEDVPDVVLKQVGIDGKKVGEVMGTLDSQVEELTQILLMHGAPPESSSQAGESPRDISGKRIVFVGQGEREIDSVGLLLEHCGAVVERAADAAAAIVASPDAVFLRWNTPEWLATTVKELQAGRAEGRRVHLTAVGERKPADGFGESIEGCVLNALRSPFYVPDVLSAVRVPKP